MHKRVAVCSFCRMPLIAGCYGGYCCEMCYTWSCEARASGDVSVSVTLAHGADCRQRLADLLADRVGFAFETD